jgi:hypothetical protein
MEATVLSPSSGNRYGLGGRRARDASSLEPRQNRASNLANVLVPPDALPIANTAHTFTTGGEGDPELRTFCRIGSANEAGMALGELLGALRSTEVSRHLGIAEQGLDGQEVLLTRSEPL